MTSLSVSPPPATTPAGPRRFGPYVLHELLGRGGMAVVYRAESRRPESLGRTVALKILRPDNAYDVDFDQVRSFVEEARLATRFDCPNIARTYSLGKVGGRYFIEMEYVAGRNLVQITRQCEDAGAMPVAVVVQILIQLCDALEHVHGMLDDTGKRLALIHRDVSLSNIIVSGTGTVKLIDFGIVKGHSSQAPTEAGTIKGKVAYVAPEYLLGRLDQRADLFALGIVAHELLTGRRLFLGANDLDTITRIRDMRVAPPSRVRPDVSAELDAIVLKALERDPDARWQTARDLGGVLRSLTGPVAAPQQVGEWIEAAFAQPRRKPSTSLNRVLESLAPVAITGPVPVFVEDAVTVPVASRPKLAAAPAEPDVEVATPRAPRVVFRTPSRRRLLVPAVGALLGAALALIGTLVY